MLLAKTDCFYFIALVSSQQKKNNANAYQTGTAHQKYNKNVHQSDRHTRNTTQTPTKTERHTEIQRTHVQNPKVTPEIHVQRKRLPNPNRQRNQAKFNDLHSMAFTDLLNIKINEYFQMYFYKQRMH